jgi:hypothetical protein
MAHRAVYKCRLCGAAYQSNIVTGTDIAAMCMTELTAGIRGTIPGAPTMTETHHCGGDHAGDMGLADFQGWVKEE